MNAAILRGVLLIAIVCGVGIVANIFGEQKGQIRQAGIKPPQPVRQLSANPKISPEQEARRLRDAVRRELGTRGYLSASARADTIATKAAILAFEFDHKLALTAEPTSGLLKALIFSEPSTTGARPTVPESDAAHQLIVEVQRALAHLGYGRATTTAELDPETRKAIRKFERARGLQASGRVSAPLIESLGPAFDSARLGESTEQVQADAG